METILSVKSLYKAKRFEVKELEVKLDSGAIVRREIVDKGGDSVAMVALDDQQRLWLVEEYFAATNERTLCLPKGMVDASENKEEAALRELQEEIGMTGKAQELLTVSVSPGYLTQKTTVFLVTNLVPQKLDGDEEHHLQVHCLTFQEAFTAMKEGRITEARTIGGIAMAKIYLNL